MKPCVYLDYAATTPVDPSVADKMVKYLTPDGQFGNPASRSHRYGWQAEEAVDIARNQVADLINADAREIIWTSGATESDNLAIKGVAAYFKDRGQHIITVATEHKAVIDTCEFLKTQGFDITYLQPESSGLISVEQVKQALRDDTILVSIMMVNNETGVVQDIAGIGALLKDLPALFHVDAAQAVGKVPFDVAALGIDLASFSAHKVYGPKGIGALYVRRSPEVKVEALIHGGGHERGMRSGTLPTHQIVGMGEAFQLAGELLAEEAPKLKQYKLRIWHALEALSGIQVNGNIDLTAPGILNITVDGVDGETLLAGLSQLAVSTGSACNSASVEPSYVLRAMGLSHEQGLNSVRISVGRFTTDEDVEFAIELLGQVIGKLRAISSPLLK